MKKYYKYLIIGICTGLSNGLFGSGGGMIAVPAMTILLGMNERKSHATAIFIILPLTLASTFIYVKGNHIDWNVTWKVAVGGIAGGYAGARLLSICPEKVLRKVFGVFIIAAAIKMLV